MLQYCKKTLSFNGMGEGVDVCFLDDWLFVGVMYCRLGLGRVRVICREGGWRIGGFGGDGGDGW